MKSFKLIIFYLLTHIFAFIHALANGCGSDSVAPGVNLFLYLTGESSLISCCNEHDNCYAKCMRQEDCDARLSTCLTKFCNEYHVDSFKRFACQQDTQTFNFFVQYFGNDFYVKGCEKRRVMLSIDATPIEMRFATAKAAIKITPSLLGFLCWQILLLYFILI